MAIKKTAGRTAYAAPGDTTPFLDHIAVWAADTEASAKFLDECMGWKRHPVIIRVSDDDPTTGGMIGTFFDSPGLWIELIEPTTPGPGQDILNELGDGALVEINFDVGDEYQKALSELSERGIEMLSMDGSPLVDGGRIDEGVLSEDGEVLNPGECIAYFPTDLTQGTTIEYYEVLSDNKGSLLYERDQAWKNVVRDPQTPFIDHVGILVEDIDAAAEFYQEYMTLKRNPNIFETTEYGGAKIAFIDANGYDDNKLWLKLVQPTGDGYATDLMKKFGKGHIFELGAQTDDIERFASKLDGFGVKLGNLDGSALPNGQVSSTLASGDKQGYIPTDFSCGVRINIFERGPAQTSMFHQRDMS